MRNLRKSFAVLLVIAMMIGAMVPAMAASESTYSDEAQSLNNLGLYKGIDANTFNPDLGNTVSRETAVVLLLRMFGQGQPETAPTSEVMNELASKFADASSISAWAVNSVHYAWKNGLVDGQTPTTFAPKSPLVGRAYCKLVLSLLGYKQGDDFQYEQSGVYFADLTGSDEGNTFNVAAPITKDTVVGISWTALESQFKGSEETIIDRLVKAGKVDQTKAEDEGITVNATPATSASPSVDPTASASPTSVPAEVYGSVNAKVEFMPARSIAAGEALVDVAKVTLSAAADKGVTVSGLRMTRTGLSSDTDLDTVTVWNGAKKISASAKFSNGEVVVGFVNPVVLNASESATVMVRVDVKTIAGGATNGAQLRFSFANSSSITVGTGVTVGGTFPVNSDMFTIVSLPVNSLGTLTIAKSNASPSTGNIDPNKTGVVIGEFKLTTTNEAQLLKSIVIYNNGNTADSDVINIKLYNGSTQVGTTVEKFESRKAGFTFETGIEIPKGDSIYLTLKADIGNGASGRTVQPKIDKTSDVLSVGKTYGTNITPSTVATASCNTLTVATGSLVVSLASINPVAGTIKADGNDQFVAAFKLQANGEPIQISTMDIAVDATGSTATDIDEIKLTAVQGTSEINLATNANPFTDANGGTDHASIAISPITISTTEPLIVKLYVDTVAGVLSTETFKFGINGDGSAATKEIEATGTVSGEDVSYKAALNPMYANVMTVGNLGITPAYMAFSGTQYAFPSQTNVLVGKLGLSHNMTEDVRVTNLVLDTANFASIFNLRITDTNGTALAPTISAPTGSDDQFRLDTAMVVKPGETKYVNVYADINSTTAGDPTVSIDTTIGVTATAVTSGNDVTQLTFTGTATAISLGNKVVAGNLNSAFSDISDLESGPIMQGQKDVKLAAAKLTLSASHEKAMLKKVRLYTVYANGGNSGSFENVRLVNGSGTILERISDLTAGEIYLDLDNPQELIKAIDGTTELAVVADVVTSATAGGRVTLDFTDDANNDADADFEYTGVSSGETVTTTAGTTTTPVTYTVTPSKVTFTAVAVEDSTPVAAAAGGTEIARFKVKNEGTKTIYLDKVRLDDVLSSTKEALTTSNRDGAARLLLTDTNYEELGTGAQSQVLDTTADDDIEVTIGGGLMLAGGAEEIVLVVLSADTTDSIDVGDRVKIKVDSAGTTFEESAAGLGVGGSNFPIYDDATGVLVTFE